MSTHDAVSVIQALVERMVRGNLSVFQGFAVVSLFPTEPKLNSVILAAQGIGITLGEASAVIEEIVHRRTAKEYLRLGGTDYMVTTTRERTWYAISVTQGNPGWLLLNRIDRLLLIVLVRAGALVEQAIAPFETLVARMAQSAELATGGRFG